VQHRSGRHAYNHTGGTTPIAGRKGEPMSTPTYVVKLVNGQYVTVPVNTCAGSAAAWVLGGGLLLVNGVRRGGLIGAASSLLGASLIARGILGYNPLQNCCSKPEAPDGPSSQTPSYQNDHGVRSPQMPEDLVDEQSMESFPASDPPARTVASRTA